MGKFEETKKKIVEEGSSNKKTFNESYFNELATALLNDPEYEKTEMVTRKGELTPISSRPIAELRKGMIGGVAKAAGADAAEQEKLIAEYQFPKLPMYDYVDSALHEYLGLGKKFPLSRKENFQGSIEFTEQKACIKDVKAPGSTVSKKQRQGDYIKLRAKSNCPDNLKSDL
jgi:hypothetical protein